MLRNGIIWLAALFLAGLSALLALGTITKNKAPEISLSLTPLNGFAAETFAANKIKTRLAETKGKFPDTPSASTIAFAQRAFAAEALVPDAIAILAMSQSGAARGELMKSAYRLSRRQELTNAWLINDSGAREDIPTLLSIYDTSLRTGGSSQKVLIAAMAGALSNDAFVDPFASMLSKNPPWAVSFWNQVTTKPNSLLNAVRLRQLLYKSDENSDLYRDAGLVRALVNAQQFEAATRLHTLLSNAGNRQQLIHNPDFVGTSALPPVDWELMSTGEYGAAMSDGYLQMSAVANSGGLLARQLLELPSGLLVLKANLPEAVPNNARITVALECAENTGKKSLPAQMRLTGKSVEQTISSQDDRCRYYWLNISGKSADNGSGFDVALDSISLQRAVGAPK